MKSLGTSGNSYATKPFNLSENVVTQALPTFVTVVKNIILFFFILQYKWEEVFQYADKQNPCLWKADALQEWINTVEQWNNSFFHIETGTMGGIDNLENVLSLINIKIHSLNQNYWFLSCILSPKSP